MDHKIIIGRSIKDQQKLGDQALVNLGKLFVTMGQTTSLSAPIYLDVAKPHVLLISGKRGSGKSYSSSVIAEEMTKLPDDVKQNISVLFFDTLGVFWTMKYPNDRQSLLLESWGLQAEGLDVDLYCPQGYYTTMKEEGIPVDYSFALQTSELTASDWCDVFEISPLSPYGVLLDRIVAELQALQYPYGIEDILEKIRISHTSQEVLEVLENLFLTAKTWGLFERKGTLIEEFFKGGKVAILDLSAYTASQANLRIKALVIGLVSKKLLAVRIAERKKEEIQEITEGVRYFGSAKIQERPMVWIIIDEAHNFLKKEEKTPATDALVSLLREGRQPGISLVLVTQQPGEIHKDVLTQSDIVLSHRVTAKADIEALNAMMQSYLISDLQTYLNQLPKESGAGVILDDNSERMYPLQVHPKRSWHGGEAPSAVKINKKEEFNTL